MMTKEIETIHDLNRELSVVWFNLKERKIKPQESDAFSNMAGKYLLGQKLRLEAFAQAKQDLDCPFLLAPSGDKK